MTEPRDIRELVGDDLPEEELAELARVDALLRSVPPPPPEVPASLTRAVRATAPTPIWTRRRVLAAVALAAALSALFFGVGAWTTGGSDGFEARAAIPLHATDAAQGASGLIRLGPRDAQGNWTLELRTSGLPRLPKDGYYLLWLAKDGEYAGACGTFRAGPGASTVRMNASYDLANYDAWVVTAVTPKRPWSPESPRLLDAKIRRA